MLLFSLSLLVLWVNKSTRTQTDKRLTRLYSSLFPRSSSSSLCRRESDLQEAEGGAGGRRRERDSALVNSSAASAEEEFISCGSQTLTPAGMSADFLSVLMTPSWKGCKEGKENNELLESAKML